MEVRILNLEATQIDSSIAVRDRAVAEKLIAHENTHKYDFQTLVYGAVWDSGKLTLVCPKLLNFEEYFKNFEFEYGGIKLKRPRIKKYYRHDIVVFKAREYSPNLTLETGSFNVTISVRQPDFDFFRSLNTEICLSKNENLSWIKEHLSAHVNYHGLEAVFFVDNGSTDYSIDDLEKAIRETGLKKAIILSAPVPFGPLNLPGKNAKELFFQTSMYNLAKLMYLKSARAVLCVDIDEVMMPPLEEGHTIFDEAINSFWGAVFFGGKLVYPQREDAPPFSFSQHILAKPDAKLYRKKWCLAPSGRLKRYQWRVHCPEGFLLSNILKHKKPRYYDCQGITTGWKAADRYIAPKNAAPDGAAIDFFQVDRPRVFSQK